MIEPAAEKLCRSVTFNGTSTNIEGETSSILAGVSLSGTQRLFELGGWRFEGALNADVLRQSQDSFREGGTNPLALSYDDIEADGASAQALLRAERAFTFGPDKSEVITRFAAGYGQQSVIDDRVMDARFAQSGASIELQGDTSDLARGIVSGEADWRLGDGASIRFGYQGEFGDGDRSTVRIGYAKAF